MAFPQSLNAKQIGYLRQLPPASGKFLPVSGPVKSMARKLNTKGYVEFVDDKRTAGRRTQAGDEILQAFDNEVRAQYEDLLNRLDRRPDLWNNATGVQKLLDAGLIRMPMNDRPGPVLTDAGRRVLDGQVTGA